MAEFRMLLGDRVLVESPRWHDDRLVFSDWGAGEIVAVDLDGTAEVVANVSTVPFCIDRLPDGRLIVVTDRKLLVCAPDGTLAPYADLSQLSTKPWNDIVIDGRGNIYVNNIGFDFPGGEFAPGIVALVSPDGKIRQVADGLAFPNGMAVTQDNSTLLVAESYGGRRAGRDLRRCRGRGVVRQRARQALRPGRGRRGGAPDHRVRPRLLRVHARRHRGADPVRRRCHVAGRDDRRQPYRAGARHRGRRPGGRLAALTRAAVVTAS
jgi:sugar lactone lactonase YvrE